MEICFFFFESAMDSIFGNACKFCTGRFACTAIVGAKRNPDGDEDREHMDAKKHRHCSQSCSHNFDQSNLY